METFIWSTEYAHNDNYQTMQEYLDEYCQLDITFTDGTYAEGMDNKGNLWAIHASGNGDFCNHKIEFELI
jgi:hypothetical protein